MLEQATLSSLKADGTDFVRLVWADANGMLRGEGVHVSQLPKLCTEGLGVVTGVMGTTSTDAIPPKLSVGSVGQVWLRPDASTLRPLPWAPRQVSCMGDFVEADGSPWACCPRQALRRQIDALYDLGFTMHVGFEPEFTLLVEDNDGSLRPVDAWHYASIHGLNSESAMLEAMATALQAQGVVVETMLAESGSGQYEFAIGHDAPMVTADRMLIVRETIPVIAREYGLVSTMLPKVLADEAGNGCHMHFSLWRDGNNCMSSGSPRSFTPEAEAFTAGVLRHLSALVGLAAPSPPSAVRIGPGAWAGGFVCWGWDNKEASLRVPTEQRGGPCPQHVELKTSDATCNPYLAIAGLIAAGIDGLAQGSTLPEPVLVDPATCSPTPTALPSTVGTAMDVLERDTVLAKALGQPLLDVTVAVRRLEAAHHEGCSLEELVSRLAKSW
jgi:glutamine synthetase